MDIERAVKVAGARSYTLKGDAARMELALMNFALDRISRKGFTPLIVPAMAREFAFIGNGQFPKGRDQVYAIEGEELSLSVPRKSRSLACIKMKFSKPKSYL